LTKSLNILICPLEWGLGHAARMIPLARKLLEMNHKVIIGSGEEHLSLFRKELPGLLLINFPGFKPRYSRFFPQYLSLLFKTPLLLYHIVAEHHKLKKILNENAVDIIISDNRFGLWNRRVTCVYITHMLLIPFPRPFEFLESIGVAFHQKIIKKYSYCFIPDLPGDLSLTGRLSHSLKLPDNVRFIGILSRFINTPQIATFRKSDHTTVILSGPQPQREMLREKLIALLKNKETKTIMFEGNPDRSGNNDMIGNIFFYSHLPGPRMREIIESSRNIIARSGYTSIMELVSLNCTALIIPTPGQTEQEYLAKYLSEKGWFNTVGQDELSDGISFGPCKPIPYEEINRQSGILLDKALREVLEKHHKEAETGNPCQ
jgi:UDP:flavonoid glycosyltransferase YjiC (YdhE family)